MGTEYINIVLLIIGLIVRNFEMKYARHDCYVSVVNGKESPERTRLEYLFISRPHGPRMLLRVSASEEVKQKSEEKCLMVAVVSRHLHYLQNVK